MSHRKEEQARRAELAWTLMRADRFSTLIWVHVPVVIDECIIDYRWHLTVMTNLSPTGTNLGRLKLYTTEVTS